LRATGRGSGGVIARAVAREARSYGGLARTVAVIIETLIVTIVIAV